MNKFFILFSLFLIIPLVSSAVLVGDSESVLNGVSIDVPEFVFDNNTAFVNLSGDSLLLQGMTPQEVADLYIETDPLAYNGTLRFKDNHTFNGNVNVTGNLTIGGPEAIILRNGDAPSISVGGSNVETTVDGTTFFARFFSHLADATVISARYGGHSNTQLIAPNVFFGRSRGTETTPTSVTDGSRLGIIQFGGYESTDADYNLGASMEVVVDGTPGQDDMPSRIVFSTTPSGSNTPVERIRIGSDGSVNITNNITGHRNFTINGITPDSAILWNYNLDRFTVGDNVSEDWFPTALQGMNEVALKVQKEADGTERINIAQSGWIKKLGTAIATNEQLFGFFGGLLSETSDGTAFWGGVFHAGVMGLVDISGNTSSFGGVSALQGLVILRDGGNLTINQTLAGITTGTAIGTNSRLTTDSPVIGVNIQTQNYGSLSTSTSYLAGLQVADQTTASGSFSSGKINILSLGTNSINLFQGDVTIGTGVPDSGFKFKVNGKSQYDDDLEFRADGFGIGRDDNFLRFIDTNVAILTGLTNFTVYSNTNIIGDLFVDGDVNITGNLTNNEIYGDMHFHNDSAGGHLVPIAVQGTWVNVTGFNSTYPHQRENYGNGIVFDESLEALVCLFDMRVSSWYKISYGNAGNNQEYQSMLAVNGVRQHITDDHRKVGAAGDVASASGGGSFNCSSGDFIQLQMRDNDGTADLEIHVATVILRRIGTQA